MKKVIFNPENPNGLEVELTADEVSQVQAQDVKVAEKDETELAEKNQNETDQANGKSKSLQSCTKFCTAIACVDAEKIAVVTIGGKINSWVA